MAFTIEDLEELITVLRENGVTYYASGGIAMALSLDADRFGASASASAPAGPSAQTIEPVKEVEPPKMGYKHPSLGLYSWPDSKESP